jgi:hypothetical protein
MNNRIIAIIVMVYAALPTASFAKDPQCNGIESWPTAMAFVQLKNAGIADNDDIDFSKTATVRIASQKMGKDPYYHEDLYRQVHNVKFIKKSGEVIELITVSDATHSECSMGKVDVFVVSSHL